MLTKVKKLLSNLLSGHPRLFDAVKSAYRVVKKDYIYRKISEFLKQNSSVHFVQIGSNDGLLNDPLREFIVQGKLRRGILIEPIPYLFKSLVKNYRSVRSNELKFWNGAVLAEGNSILYTIREDRLSNYPKTATQISSFDRQHVAKHFPDSESIQNDIEEIKVRNFSISEILDDLGGEIDLLQIDIEGGEFDLIFAFPFQDSKPKMIIYEVDHMRVDERRKLQDYLEGLGYKVGYDTFDAVAQLESL